ncbi:unnamed protein product [Spirodela intermedia]|uniref:Uncharacterized protein n=1 Tax=Spirodela intermedia TaxID=51605 RepID=A0A7I8KUX8_SPIIN|nr:unnamed protein product [Spirodela intermedia]
MAGGRRALVKLFGKTIPVAPPRANDFPVPFEDGGGGGGEAIGQVGSAVGSSPRSRVEFSFFLFSDGSD